VIISIQTFGDLLIWHPHIHCLVTDGVFNATGNFHPIPKIDTEKAMIIFREKVFKMFNDNNRISDTLIFKMRHWNHSGFSVNNEVYINKDNPEALERLAQYIVHSSFSADKIKYIEETGSVMYKSNIHLAKKRNFEALDAIEFIHRICLHIPDHYESLIRYYGSSSLKAMKNKVLFKCCSG
jgi:hypothetical protein